MPHANRHRLGSRARSSVSRGGRRAARFLAARHRKEAFCGRGSRAASDACNFGPGPAGHVDTPDQAAAKHDLLRRHCDAVGRPHDHILRTHFTHWLLLAPDDQSLAAKIEHYFPHGLDGFWANQLIARTPDAATAYYRAFAAAGTQYFVVQTLDPHDDETLHLLAEHVAPQVRN